MKTGCTAAFQVSARTQNGSSFLEISKINLDHNHQLTEVDFKMYPANRHLKGEELSTVNNLVRFFFSQKQSIDKSFFYLSCCVGFLGLIAFVVTSLRKRSNNSTLSLMCSSCTFVCPLMASLTPSFLHKSGPMHLLFGLRAPFLSTTTITTATFLARFVLRVRRLNCK